MGYILIDRKITEWEWYSDINTYRLFTHMLYKANWKEGKFKGVEIDRGSFVSSIKKLSDETNLTEREVRTAISHLKSTGEVTSTAYSKFSVFTVFNYNKYQSNDTQNDMQVTSKRHSNDIQTTTIEEGNKVIKKNKENTVKKDVPFEIVEIYNAVCLSYPKVTKLSDSRRRAINARLKKYDLDDFKSMFGQAEKSEFLKGDNSKNWNATFDWMIKDSNMAKILDGNYANKPKQPKNKFQNFEGRKYDMDDLERQLLERQ